MPELLSKSQALEFLSKEADAPECLICRISRNAAYPIAEDAHCIVLLSEYPRFWGHILVCLKRHAEKHTELSAGEHAALYRQAHRSAKALEKLFRPSRCYVAALGSEEQRINTCPHIHIHVIPVADKSTKPSEVFTWGNGVYRGSKKEWKMLCTSIKSVLPAV